MSGGAPTTVAAAAAIVLPHLPDGIRGPLEPIGEGDFCFAYRAGEHIVRIAKHEEAAAAIRREACVLRRIADPLPLEVPRPTYREPYGAPPFTVHREVRGDVLTRTVWEGLPPSGRARVAEQLATFLRRLHGLTEEGAACGVPQLDEAALADRLRRAARTELVGHLSPGVLRRLDTELAARAADRAEQSVALLHCDLAPGHVLCDAASGQLTGVIDFGDVAVGPVARDFIYLYEDFGVELFEEVVAAYVEGDPLGLMEDVRAWYLLEALTWTLKALRTDRQTDVEQGLGEIAREIGGVGRGWTREELHERGRAR